MVTRWSKLTIVLRWIIKQRIIKGIFIPLCEINTVFPDNDVVFVQVAQAFGEGEGDDVLGAVLLEVGGAGQQDLAYEGVEVSFVQSFYQLFSFGKSWIIRSLDLIEYVISHIGILHRVEYDFLKVIEHIMCLFNHIAQ